MLEIDKIYHMDCIDGMKLLSENSIDLVVTSPPYDNLREYNNSSTWNFDIFKNVANELYRVVKDGGVVVWIVSDACINGSETGTSFKQALYFKEIGFNIHDTMIWEKESFRFPDKTRYGNCFEYMFIFSKGKPKSINLIKDRVNKLAGTLNLGTSRAKNGTIYRKSNDNKTFVQEVGFRFNIWNISSERNNTSGHPAVFPLQLAIDHIISWSNENDIILDPFIGSGTTAIASKYLKRHFIGFEIDEQYYNIACNRLKEKVNLIVKEDEPDYKNTKLW